MGLRDFEAAQQSVAEDVANVYSNKFRAEQFMGRSVCSVLVSHARYVFDEGRLRSADVEPDHVTRTELGSHIQDIALNFEHRATNRGPAFRTSEFCSMAEPLLLKSLDELEAGTRESGSAPVIVVGSSGEPTGFVKHRGDRSMYSLRDSNIFTLGAAALYVPVYEKEKSKKSKNPDLFVLEQKEITNVIPGRVSVLSGSQDDLKGYDPAKIYRYRGSSPQEKQKWRAIARYSKQLCRVTHDSIVRRVDQLAETI